MYFAYFDESGDSGYSDKSSECFTLACVLVHESDWLSLLDQTVNFRRYLKTNFKIPVRCDLKSNELLGNKGPFKNIGLSFQARLNLYNAIMRFQRKTNLVKVFAVVINKRQIFKRDRDPRELAWVRAIERLVSFGRANNSNIHILPDEGHGYFIRRKLREMRRVHYIKPRFGGNNVQRLATNIIEDTSDRKSHESFFIQLADFNSYAAYRKMHPKIQINGSFWDNLGDVRIKEVNRLRGGDPGIVSWP